MYHLHLIQEASIECSCGSVVEHCVRSAKVVGSIPREHTYKKCIAWMHCKSLWIKAFAKCINVNVELKSTLLLSLFIFLFGKSPLYLIYQLISCMILFFSWMSTSLCKSCLIHRTSFRCMSPALLSSSHTFQLLHYSLNHSHLRLWF